MKDQPTRRYDFAPADGAPRDERAAAARRTQRKALIAVAGIFVAIAVVMGGLVLASRRPQGCGSYRRNLVEAKQLRALLDLKGSDDVDIARREVALQARAAREHGCNVDDLIDPSVGR